MPGSEEILEANKALRTEIKGFKNDLINLENKEKKTRYLSYFLAFTLIMTFGLVLNEKSNRASDKSQLNTNYLVNSCTSANEGRANEGALWGDLQDLIHVLLPKPPSYAKEKIDVLQTRASATYAQRDCEAVKEGKIVTVDPLATPTGTPN